MNMEEIKKSFETYFVDIVKNHYTDFNGRATRTQFWMFNLYVFAVVFIVAMIASILHLKFLAMAAGLAVFVPSICMSIRRVRDLGVSGWCILLSFVPFIGGILVLIGYCMPTDYLKPYAEQAKQKYLEYKNKK